MGQTLPGPGLASRPALELEEGLLLPHREEGPAIPEETVLPSCPGRVRTGPVPEYARELEKLGFGYFQIYILGCWIVHTRHRPPRSAGVEEGARSRNVLLLCNIFCNVQL